VHVRETPAVSLFRPWRIPTAGGVKGRMSLELWNTLGTWGTFVVIAATCVTAIIQLRHVRTSNQLGNLLTTFGVLQDPSLRDLITFVRHDLQDRVKDEAYRVSLLNTPVVIRTQIIHAYPRQGFLDGRLSELP
jgi:hypothetical protein